MNKSWNVSAPKIQIILWLTGFSTSRLAVLYFEARASATALDPMNRVFQLWELKIEIKNNLMSKQR